MKKFLYVSLTLLVALLSSCSETSEEDTEFADWQNRNDAYFAQIYNQAKSAIDNGDTSWKIIRSYSKNPEVNEPTLDIVVKVINEGNPGADGAMPLYTDSIKLHYRGYIMPSESYKTVVPEYPTTMGFQFDSSWYGDYNLPAMNPITKTPSYFIDGFATALTNMHCGDRWLVYIPHNLGYGATSQTSIPSYSTLIFDITFSDFYKKRTN